MTTLRAPLFGLTAIQPADLDYGWDLGSRSGRAAWLHALREGKPLLTILGFPCTPWCIFNRNINFKDRPQVLEAIQDKDRPLLQITADTAVEQHKAGRFFLLENPPGSDAWNQKELDKVFALDGVISGIIHMCEFGAVGRRGKPIKKAMRIVTNSSALLEALTEHRCGAGFFPHAADEHETVEGGNTKDSQEYTEAWADVVLTWLSGEAQRRDARRFCERIQVYAVNWVPSCSDYDWQPPGHVQRPHQVLYLDAVRDVSAWLPALEQATKMMENTSTTAAVVGRTQPIFQEIQKLVPWEITRVQLVKLPKARRLTGDILCTHRGALLQSNSGELWVETEAVGSLSFPRQRFVQPVRFGIFFFGMAPQEDERPAPPPEQQEEEPEQQEGTPTAPPPRAGDEITFPGVSRDQVPDSIRAAVARLHTNLGHCSREDLVRCLAQFGATPAAMTAANALTCQSCDRRPHRPRTRSAKIPRPIGQFGDRLVGDIFYTATVDGRTLTMVGFICDATSLHIVGRIKDRTPAETYGMLRVGWLLPFGVPSEVLVDRDGAFYGDFLDRLSRLGVLVTYIPAEAHHQLVKIERANDVWRWTFERVVDAHAITTDAEVDDAVVEVNYGKNSTVRTHGRCAYQAAFGRVPRIPGELLSDPTSFITTSHRENHITRSELYRAEALKGLAEYNVNEEVRRGIFTKTARLKMDDLVGGEKVAYWRDQAISRGPGKGRRPGYVAATFAATTKESTDADKV